MKLFFLWVIPALLLGQASAPKRGPIRYTWVRVQIKFVEGETGAPMAGIEFIVRGSSVIQGPFERRLTTTNDGTARLQLLSPGSYTINVGLEDYVPSFDTSTAIELTTTDRTKDATVDLKLVYFRESQVSGKLADYETGEPLGDVHVNALLVRYSRGVRQLLPKSSLGAVSKADGTFLIGNLPPGNYVLEIGAPTAQELVKQADLPEVKGPKRILWPGGGESSDFFHVLSKWTENVGTVMLRSGILPGITLSVDRESCRIAPRYSVMLSEVLGPSPILRGEFPLTCDEPLKLRGFSPGKYELQANDRADVHASDSSDIRRTGFVDFEIDAFGKDVSDKLFEIATNSPISIAGHVQVEGQEAVSNPPPIPAFRVRLQPHPDLPVVHLPVFDSSTVTPDGGFDASAMVDPEKKVGVSPIGLSGTYVLKSVIYNNVAFAGTVFEANPLLTQHELRLMISDKLGKLTGKVEAPANTDLSRVRVLAVPWPVEMENEYPSRLSETAADHNGEFEMDGLLAGAYKVLAVSADHRPELEKPGRLMIALGGMDVVNVVAGGSVEVVVGVRQP